MRPEILFPLFATLPSLPGVGPKLAKLIEGLAGPHLVDLLWHLPTSIVDRRFSPKIAEAPDGVIATLEIRVDQHQPPPPGNRRAPYKVVCSDSSGFLTLTFFHAKGDYLMRQLPPGETRVISGKVEHYGHEIQITHPDHIAPVEEIEQVRRVEPVYPLTAGLSNKVLAKAIRHALDKAPAALPEWLDPAFKQRQGWDDWRPGARAGARSGRSRRSGTHVSRPAAPRLRRVPGQPARPRPGARRRQASDRTPGARRRTPAAEGPGRPALQPHASPERDAGGNRRRHGFAGPDAAAAARRRGLGARPWSPCWPCSTPSRPAARPP